MNNKSTEELEKVLGETHITDMKTYLSDNKESIISSDRPFSDFFRSIVKKKKMNYQDVFLDADIPERYGYKLIAEEKHTRQRDTILRLCYAAKMSLYETQRALKYYRMPELYAKIPRDALIMICFNERPGSIIDVNSYLKNNGMDVLRSSGVQE